MKARTFTQLALLNAIECPGEQYCCCCCQIPYVHANSRACPLPAKGKQSSLSLFNIHLKKCWTWLDRQANEWSMALYSILLCKGFLLALIRTDSISTQLPGVRSVCQPGIMTYTQEVCAHSSCCCKLQHGFPTHDQQRVVLVNAFKEHFYSSWWVKTAKLKNNQFEEMRHGSRRTFYFCLSILPSF